MTKKSDSVYKAVIFDMGGVFLPDPFQKFRDFERLMNLPNGVVSRVLVKGWVDGPWGRIMTGQMTVPDFARVFCGLLSQEIDREIAADTVVTFMSSYDDAKAYPEMIEAVHRVHAQGLRTALLTNNCFLDEDKTLTLLPLDRTLFDVIVESCVLGYSKPHPHTYRECLDRLGIRPDQAIFLDDQNDNVKAATSVGITAIKVDSPHQAVQELYQILGLSLDSRRIADKKPVPSGPMSDWDSRPRKHPESSDKSAALIYTNLSDGS